MTNATKQINEWIEQYGNARDALNAALAKLDLANRKIRALNDCIPYQDCPECQGIIVHGWTCLDCGHDPTAK